MANRRSEQEWHSLVQTYERSFLTQKAFFRQHKISPSTFWSKRRAFLLSSESQQGGFVQAQVVEQTTENSTSKNKVAL